MNDVAQEFNRGALRPVECLRSGWQLVKNDYWFFLGVTVVGLLIGGAAPLGILLGPMMCGIHMCLFRQARGQRVSFNILFEGFHLFGPSFVVTLFNIIPIMLMIFVGYIAMFLSFGLMIPMQAQAAPGGRPDPTGLLLVFGVQIALILGITVVVMVLQALLFFAYPLVVDRGLSGMDAVRTSIKACFGNLGGLVGIMILETLLSYAGIMACCVGIYLVIPLSMAARSIAYRQVFPDLMPDVRDMDEGQPDDLPAEPAPAVVRRVEGEPSTDIQQSRSPTEFRGPAGG